MGLEDLKLKKEEFPILHEHCFYVPIHPNLLKPEMFIPTDLASIVFPKTAEEWFEDLKSYREIAELDDQMARGYDEYWLKEKPKISVGGDRKNFENLFWEGYHLTLDNGFTHSLSISRDAGGSLYFNQDGEECRELFFMEGNNRYLKFSKEKAEEFAFEDRDIDNEKVLNLYVYAQHDVDHYPGALFLRNWAVNYINKALEFVVD